jgi:hypothetical protein
MPLIGYARVSTEDQTPLPQLQARKSAGCADIYEEQASGGNRTRPVLARVVERIGKGDTLVVVCIDRLARSLSHLLELIEHLEAKGTFLLATVLCRAARRESDDRLPAIAAAIRGADPDVALQATCVRLEAMRERTPRGRSRRQPSSERMLLQRAAKLGLITSAE